MALTAGFFYLFAALSVAAGIMVIVAMVFLQGKISTLFSKVGNSLT